MTTHETSRATAVLTFVKIAVLLGLGYLAWQWRNVEPPPPVEPSDELLARLDALDARLRSKSLIAVDAELGRLHERLDDLERMLAAPPGTFTRPLRPAGGEVTESERTERAPMVMGNALKSGARSQVEVLTRHVKGVSKPQLGKIQEIFMNAKSREAAAYDELRGQPNPARLLAPILEEIRMERYMRLSEVLDDEQMRQLGEVPLPLVPRSVAVATPAREDGSGNDGEDDGGSR